MRCRALLLLGLVLCGAALCAAESDEEFCAGASDAGDAAPGEWEWIDEVRTTVQC